MTATSYYVTHASASLLGALSCIATYELHYPAICSVMTMNLTVLCHVMIINIHDHKYSTIYVTASLATIAPE